MRILLLCTGEVYEDTMRIPLLCTGEVYENTIVVYR